jgi:hypothetical protein
MGWINLSPPSIILTAIELLTGFGIAVAVLRRKHF